MRDLISIVEAATEQQFLHATHQRLNVGDKLRPSGENLPDRFVEEIFDDLRPDGAPSRLRSVFMADSKRTLRELHLTDRPVYVVEPEGPVSRYDALWLERACELDEDMAEIGKCARGYWSGEPLAVGFEVWEFLTSSAIVVDEL